MTFPNDDTCVIKKEYSDEEISAVLVESRQALKHMRKSGKIIETVAAYRLREMKNLQAVEKLATWRRTHGYDRDDRWMHGTRPLALQELIATLWEEVNALKEAISMSGRARPWQKTKEFFDGLKGDLPDEELAAIKPYVKRRNREGAQVTVTSVRYSTVSPARLLPRYRPMHVSVWIWRKKTKRVG